MHSGFAKVRLIFSVFALILGFGVWLGMTGETNKAQLRQVIRKYEVPEKFRSPDAITDSIRSSTKMLFHVPLATGFDRNRISSLGKIVSDHGSFVIVSADSSVDAKRLGEGAYSIETAVNLPGASFDPLLSPPVSTIDSVSSSKFGKGYFVVQLGDVATDDILNSIRGMGLEVLQYVPNNAFFVYGEFEDAGRLVNHSRVRWLGEYLPEQKISPELTNGSRDVRVKSKIFNVAVFARADLQQATADILAASGGELIASFELQSSFFNVVRVSMDPALVTSVASVADVVRIDSYSFPVREDERAAHIVAGNYTNTTTIASPGYDPLTQFGVDGTGVTVAVTDDGVSIPGNGGFYLTTGNTVDANLRGATAGASGGHGHINASIIAGAAPFGILDPLGYNYGVGIAPKANIVNIPLLKSGYAGSDAEFVNDVVTTPGPNGVASMISNNSWGSSPTTGNYNSFAAEFDSFARDSSIAVTVDPHLFVFSAGNSGVSGLTQPKMAKNIIAVGNSENLRTELSTDGNNIDDMRGSSSRGPAADGRIKPDITAPGTVITGSRAGTTCGSVSFCFDANHSWSTGTSHAAPQVAGVAALFEQYWRSTHSGTRPSIALTKAAILQTGQEMTGFGSATSLPNGDEGWGRVNMKYMLNTGASMKYTDQASPLLSPGENVVYNGKVVDITKPFRATLVWTDPPGVSDPALVNNLDLSIMINGNTYRGNNFSGGISIAGGSADIRNNVEHIWLTGLAADTTVTITVNAAALNGDGIIGNGDSTDQNFALVVYNYTDAAPTNFNITGRVTSPAGRSISNATVDLMSGSTLVTRARTNSFGFYTLYAVPGSTAYTAVISAKRYTFNNTPVVLGSSDLQGINFTAVTGSP